MDELKILKNQITFLIDDLKQKKLIREKQTQSIKIKTKDIRKEKETSSKGKPLGFHRIHKKRKREKEEDEIVSGFFLKIAEEDKKVYNQTPVNTLIEDMAKLKNGLLTNVCFTLGDDGETESNQFFEIVVNWQN